MKKNNKFFILSLILIILFITSSDAFSQRLIGSFLSPLGVSNGGTGASTLTGILRGNGTDAITASENITLSKTSGVAGESCLYEANSTDTNVICWRGPASRSADLYLQFPDADPTVNQILVFPAPTNTVSTASWKTYGDVKRVGSFSSPITSSGTYSLSAENAYNSIIFYNDTDTFQLPVAVAGMNLCVYVAGTNLTTIDPNGTDVAVVDGVANAAGDAFTISGAVGNYVCLLADADNHWITLGFKGTLTAL